MKLFKTKSPIRNRIIRVIEDKINEAEAEHEVRCGIAQGQFEHEVKLATDKLEAEISNSEDAAVQSILGPLI